MGSLFIFIGILIISAHLFAAFFSRWRVPDILLLMAVGVLVGPVLQWVTPSLLDQAGGLLSSFTLLFILFDSGVDMRLSDVRRYWRSMVRIMLLSILAITATVTITCTLLGLAWSSAMLLGVMLSGTAAAVVIPLINQMQVSSKLRTILSLESALSAVICIILTWAIIEGMKLGKVNPAGILGPILFSFLLSAGLGLVVGVIWSHLLYHARKLQHSMFLTPALMFIIYGLVETLGYNGSIAALAFGIVLGNPHYFSQFTVTRWLDNKQHHKHHGIRQMHALRREEKSFYKEIVFILKTFFFVYIGICIPFTHLNTLLFGLVITIVIFGTRCAVALATGRGQSRYERMVVSIMTPKGLASAILATMPEQVNNTMGYTVIPGATFIKDVTYAVIFCSIIITSILVAILKRRTDNLRCADTTEYNDNTQIL